MTAVKICGITNMPDALVAAQAGADLLGLVFYPPSPRCITPAAAVWITRAIREHHPRVMLVGVFVDESREIMVETAALCRLDCVQLHGEEPVETVEALMADGLAVIKGFRIRDAATLAKVSAYQPTYCLLDAYVPGSPGGTGQAFDWRIARSFSGCAPILLAGGLRPDNVAEAVRVARPWGVDVSSGVEAAPGRKDARKVQRFIAAAKGAPSEGDRT